MKLSIASRTDRDSSEQTNAEETSSQYGNTQPKSTTNASLVVETASQSAPPKSEATSDFTIFDSYADDSLNQGRRHLTVSDSVSKKLTLEDSLNLPDEDIDWDKRIKPDESRVHYMDNNRDSILPVVSPQIALSDSIDRVLLAETTDSLALPEDSVLTDEKRSYKGLFLMPYFGPSMSLKTLYGNDQNLREKRENEEQNPITTDLGVMVRYGFSTGFILGHRGQLL